MPVINITQDQMERFQKIHKNRPQDSKAHETFNYLLRVFEEREQMVSAPTAFAANIAQTREPAAQSPDALYAKRKEAILAQCYDCMGFYADGYSDCKNSECMLYDWMPKRRK